MNVTLPAAVSEYEFMPRAQGRFTIIGHYWSIKSDF